MVARQQQMEEDAVPASKEPPKFSSTLKNLSLIEGQTALLECKFSPTDDPNLKIAWLLNGKVSTEIKKILLIQNVLMFFNNLGSLSKAHTFFFETFLFYRRFSLVLVLPR